MGLHCRGTAWQQRFTCALKPSKRAKSCLPQGKRRLAACGTAATKPLQQRGGCRLSALTGAAVIDAAKGGSRVTSRGTLARLAEFVPDPAPGRRSLHVSLLLFTWLIVVFAGLSQKRREILNAIINLHGDQVTGESVHSPTAFSRLPERSGTEKEEAKWTKPQGKASE